VKSGNGTNSTGKNRRKAAKKKEVWAKTRIKNRAEPDLFPTAGSQNAREKQRGASAQGEKKRTGTKLKKRGSTGSTPKCPGVAHGKLEQIQYEKKQKRGEGE